MLSTIMEITDNLYHSEREVCIFEDKQAFIIETIKYIQEKADEAIKSSGVFHLVLSGGDTPRAVYIALSNIKTEWECWSFWFSDERCYGKNDPNLNSSMVYETLFKNVPINRNNIHYIFSDLGLQKATNMYQHEIANAPIFDLVLLGLGEDGHTASLFPGHTWGNEEDAQDVLAIINAPKPPTNRISLSMKRLNKSKDILFLVAGRGKQMIVNEYKQGAKMPATEIKGHRQTTMFYYVGY